MKLISLFKIFEKIKISNHITKYINNVDWKVLSPIFLFSRIESYSSFYFSVSFTKQIIKQWREGFYKTIWELFDSEISPHVSFARDSIVQFLLFQKKKNKKKRLKINKVTGLLKIRYDDWRSRLCCHLRKVKVKTPPT